MISKIRNEVKSGKTKSQVAKKYNFPLATVYSHTHDIYKIPKKPDINYRAFLLMEEPMKKGFAYPSTKRTFKDFLVLKKKLPNIRRVNISSRLIYFLDEKSNDAAKVFIEKLRKKIISYQELSPILQAFEVKLSLQKKNSHLHKSKRSYIF